MIKRKLYKRLIVTTIVLFIFLIMGLYSKDESINFKQTVSYNEENNSNVVYLLDDYNMVSMVNVNVKTDQDIEKKARKLLEILIKDGSGESNIPNGFRAVIPVDTKVISVKYVDNILKVNFSKELMDVSVDFESKVIEAIIYTLTSIDGVDKIAIYVEDDLLTKLPKSGVNLPAILDRGYGINKTYDILTYKDLSAVNIYYIASNSNGSYYVPVTKYLNDDRDKIKIIIDELASSNVINPNLMSFLNSNVKLLSTVEEIDSIFLVFNDYIFSDMDTKKILEEVIYSISYSIFDSYNVKKVIFKDSNEEICKSVLKTIE